MTSAESRREIDTGLLNAIIALVDSHTDPVVRSFAKQLHDWGSEWCEVAPQWLPAAERLPSLCEHADAACALLLGLYERSARELHWEQSYRKQDDLVGDDMLAGYGFSEVVGKRGPFVSTRVRSGIGIWGPDIVYPIHRHEAEEIYLVMSGGAEFDVGGEVSQRRAGDVVHVESMTPHGFRTTDDSLAVFYLWRNGDLRQTSRFN